MIFNFVLFFSCYSYSSSELIDKCFTSTYFLIPLNLLIFSVHSKHVESIFTQAYREFISNLFQPGLFHFQNTFNSFEDFTFLFLVLFFNFDFNFSFVLLLLKRILYEVPETFYTDSLSSFITSTLAEYLFGFNFFSVGIKVIKGVYFKLRVGANLNVPKGFP